MTWLGDAGYLGVAASTYRSEYGIPPGAHVHAGDHGHGEEEHGDGDAHGQEDHAHDVRIDLRQDRLELKGGIYAPAAFLERIDFHGAWSDYEHVELEGGEVGTRFTSSGYDARVQAVQKELGGWRGAFGLQSGRVDFGAVGAEAFVPATLTRSHGLFVLQEKSAGPLKMEFGARHDRVELEPEGGKPRRSFGATSLSASAIWKLAPSLDLRLGVDRSERAPTQEELYAGGLHVATASLEVGDAGLDTESALRGEIGLHAHHERFDLELSVYRSRFDEFTPRSGSTAARRRSAGLGHRLLGHGLLHDGLLGRRRGRTRRGTGATMAARVAVAGVVALALGGLAVTLAHSFNSLISNNLDGARRATGRQA